MLLLALGTILFGGATIASSQRLERDGRGSGGFAPPPYYPPQQPQPQNNSPAYAHVYYAQPSEDQRRYAPRPSEVRLHSENGYAFYANVEYGGQIMNMMVDNGSTYCVVGDEVYAWLQPSIGHSTRRTIRNADGRTTEVTLFTLPYLTVGDRQWQSTVTARNVETVHMPGSGCGLLGQSFLRQCDVRQSGGVMTIRGR
jgi:predicted aspartyl protease